MVLHVDSMQAATTREIPLATRDHIIQAADRLFYQRGFDATSFADIANAVQISRGNFYHHFKSKDDILDAVIVARVGATRDALSLWESQAETPAQRIRRFIHILILNRADIKRYGCPVGTLCTELAKANHGARTEATELFTLFRGWLRRQFASMGCVADADELAMHLLARTQGVATLAAAFKDDQFIEQEVRQMDAWLDACAEEAQRTAPTSRRRPRTTS
jgi:TetR/AcrR family transcriptional regulator, transcriptional repressor for nem operon